jgi:DNA repair exonuclease SbcCD ATPase subunit
MLSTGDAWTEVNFTKSKSTLVVGENGAGKSTILDAVCFALFGKPFRKINKPQLVNSINKKNMVVEIEFKVGSREYIIKRGQKPTLFEILVNGELISQNSESKEYQEMLEKTILKLNFKSFSQIVILGSASFTPFMQLPAAHRREIIEDLLDIQIFSTMNTLLKEKVALNKQEITCVSYEMKVAADRIELHNKLVKTLTDNKQTTITTKSNQLKEVTGNMQIALDVIKEHREKVITLKGNIVDEDAVSGKYSTYISLKRAGENKLKNINDSIEFLEDHESCPTCNQDIDAHFKYGSIGEKTTQKVDVETSLASLQRLMVALEERLKDIAGVHSLIQDQDDLIQDYNTQVKIYENTIKLLRDEIKSLQSEIEVQYTDDAEELTAIKRTLKAAINTKEELLKDKAALDVASVLLRDSGVKTKIIKQYIPVINKLVNKYLAAMDFFVNFELNENFEETIRSRHRDDFSYESFSEGEKMRIDLALLFTWRAISKLRNSASTNLLIMDEVFDSSLDNNGTEEFLKIINTLTADTNLFIISHKGDQLFDRFHSVIKFQKVKNFSQMVK